MQEIKEIIADKKIEPIKTGRGGRRPGSGRKKVLKIKKGNSFILHGQTLTARTAFNQWYDNVLADKIAKKIEELVDKGDKDVILKQQEQRIGKPPQTMEVSGSFESTIKIENEIKQLVLIMQKQINGTKPKQPDPKHPDPRISGETV